MCWPSRIALIVASISVALAVGCGSAENEPNLAEAAERTEAQGTGRFELRGRTKEDSESFDIACDGEADYAAKNVYFRCDYSHLGVLEMIAIAGDTYFRSTVKGEGAFSGEDKWVKETVELTDGSLGNLSPQWLLTMLRDASSDTERIGEEDVRGTSTVRYRLTVDCEKAQLDCDTTAPVEVWIDGDGVVRRVSAEDESGEYAFEFFDFGVDVRIEAPPAADVLDEKDLPDEPSSAPGHRCTGGGEPIAVEQATTVLERHGFDLEQDELGCSPEVAASLSSRDDKQDGFLYCSVLVSPDGSGSVTTVATLGRRLERVERRLENLQCTLFVEQDAYEAVERLDAALAELRR